MGFSLRGVLGSAFILVMCAVCVRLGFWQLDRLEQRRARNAAVRAGLELPPVALDPATAALAARAPDSLASRRARATGVFDPAGEVLLRGRSHGGQPGVHVVTPLILARVGAVMMVNRGWLPSPDGATLDRRPPVEPGTVAVDGILHPVPVTRDRGQPAEPGAGAARAQTYRRLDLAALRERIPRPVLPLYLQRLPEGAPPGPPVPVPPPELSEGNHLSYAVQWFSFALIGLVGLAILVLRGRRPAT